MYSGFVKGKEARTFITLHDLYVTGPAGALHTPLHAFDLCYIPSTNQDNWQDAPALYTPMYTKAVRVCPQVLEHAFPWRTCEEPTGAYSI